MSYGMSFGGFLDYGLLRKVQSLKGKIMFMILMVFDYFLSVCLFSFGLDLAKKD